MVIKTIKKSVQRYIINIVYLLHVSATHVAILRDVCYKGWLHERLKRILYIYFQTLT